MGTGQESPRVEPDWDPTSAPSELHEVYDRMREECPVAYSDRYGGFWSLFRYRDIVAAARDFEGFSSADTRIGSIPAFEMPSRRIPIQSDPPEHTRYRGLLQQFLAPELLEAFRPELERLAAEMIGAMLSGPVTEADIVPTLATPFAVRTLCRFAGVPEEAWPELSEITGRIMSHARDQNHDELRAANSEIDAFIDELVRTRQHADLSADRSVLAGLIRFREEGKPLAPEVITELIRQLLVAGHDSTGRAIAIVLHYLAGHPEVQAVVRQNLAVLPKAIAEILRIESPVQHLSRVATADVEIGGRQLSKGDMVALMWISGNHDEQRYGCPKDFDLERKPATTLTFGHGLHMCLGAPLARIEMQVVVEELLRRTVDFTIASSATRCTWPRNGFTSAPLRFTRAPLAT